MSDSALICETVVGGTMAEVRQRRDASSADMVELRLDGVRDVDVAGALEGRRLPVIVTCRPAHEGGRFDGSEQDRMALLARAITLGAEYVDVEWRSDRRALPSADRSVLVLSHHDFDATPADLVDRVRAMRAETTGPIKIAVMARALRDCVRLRDATAAAGPRIVLAMGTAGLVTRACPALFGSSWTYGGSAAPGQIDVATLGDRYRVRTTSSSTRIYALAGAPLGHSASPAMHNAAFAELGLDAVYVPFESPDAADFDEAARAFGVHGASVTAPLKEALAARVANLDRVARKTGALNTLRRIEHGGWQGANFDVAALMAPLEDRGVPLAGRSVVVLGAGGAARAAVQGMLGAGAHVRVSARRPERASALAEALDVEVASWPPPSDWDVLVNATPAGMAPASDGTPVDERHLAGRGLVYDLVYNPQETALLRLARRAGLEVIGGLDMLVAQAAAQFAWWTGQRAPVARMVAAAQQFLNDGAHAHHDADDV